MMSVFSSKSSRDILLPPQSHITHYLDITTMKSRCSEARRIARELSRNYEASIPIDTIVCLDGLEVVGAYLADELTKAGVLSMNAHQTIYITSPEYNNGGQMIFRDNVQMMIKDKNILILNGSVTTGETLSRAVSSILYYGGNFQRSQKRSPASGSFHLPSEGYPGLRHLPRT